MHRGVTLALICLPLLSMIGCERPEDPAGRQRVREATIEAEMRSRLIMTEGLKVLPLRVQSRAGTLSVSGTVHDSTQLEAVRSIAARVKGVQQVELDLTVAPPPDTTTAPPVQHRRRSAPPPAAPEESLPSLEEAG
jgi:hypothetical protein